MHTPESIAVAAFAIGALAWVTALILDLAFKGPLPRWLLAAGCVAIGVGALFSLPAGDAGGMVLSLGDYPVQFQPHRTALWLLLPALIPAFFAVLLGGAGRPRGWAVGAALSLLGALGVYGLQDGASFLIAWEVMGFGGAVMLLSENRRTEAGEDNLFMLALLEVGGVALLLAVLMLGQSLAFSTYALQWSQYGGAAAFFLGLLWLVGFGAKLGLLPFYEWYPGAYGSGSGASGALLSGIVLNAAYYALGRALLDWMGDPPWLAAFGVVVLIIGTLTAILAILYAFQQNDWRRLLAFSSAENAAVATTALGAAMVFRASGESALSDLAWTVGVLHLMGHSLAKGTLFFAADSAAALQGDPHLRQSAVLQQAPWTLGIGAVFGAMSLAAMPPTAGFVSEWYLFQSLFHDFTLKGDGSRIALALSGAGLALTAAIALATMVKLFGVGLLGHNEPHGAHHRKHLTRLPALYRVAVLVTGLAVPVFAVTLLLWLPQMRLESWMNPQTSTQMISGWLLVPLSANFAFISPALLVIVTPLLALIPIGLVWLRRRHTTRRAPLWAGGEEYATHSGATTGLAFSNALRVFYSFVYRPRNVLQRQFAGRPYFLKEIEFDYTQAPFFGPYVFTPALRAVDWLARQLRFLQNGLMNAYLAYIGVLLLIVFTIALIWSPPN